MGAGTYIGAMLGGVIGTFLAVFFDMPVLVIVIGCVIGGYIGTKPDILKNMEALKQNIKPLVCVVIAAVIFASCATMCDSGSSKKSGKKWSGLTDTEKANAKWAYEAQQVIKEKEKGK